jgi:hypothetical protein
VPRAVLAGGIVRETVVPPIADDIAAMAARQGGEAEVDDTR